MRAKSPEASDKATQAVSYLWRLNSISFYNEIQIFFFILAFKLDEKYKSNFKILKFFPKVQFSLSSQLYIVSFWKTQLKIKLKDYLELSCINTSQVST